MHVRSDALVFEIEGQKRCLVISRGPESAVGAKVSLKSRKEAGITRNSHGYISSIPVDAIFGFYDLLSGPYVAVVTRSKQRFIDVAAGMELRQASKIYLVPLLRHPLPLDEEGRKEEARLLALLRQAIASHQLYFSTAFDVTRSLQRHAAAGGGAAANIAAGGVAGSSSGGGRIIAKEAAWRPWETADTRFFWNRAVVEPIVMAAEEAATAADKRAAAAWVTPAMSAFVQVEEGCEAGEGGRRFTLLFVSRRCRFRQGTRYARRGIDDAGDVANFVETEQALLFEDGQRLSHVQVRGSIPLFWSSPVNLRYHPPVHLGNDSVRHVAALRKHAASLLEHYGSNSSGSGDHSGGDDGGSSSGSSSSSRSGGGIADGGSGAGSSSGGGGDGGSASEAGGVVIVNLVDKKSDQGLLGRALDAALETMRRKADKEATVAAAAAAAAKDDVDTTAADEPLGASAARADGGKAVPLPAALSKDSNNSSRGGMVTTAGRDKPVAAAAATPAEKEAAAREAARWSRQVRRLRHVWFDFHEECRGQKFENLDKLLAEVGDELEAQGFLHVAANGTVLRWQDGVLRTNCMDCLDRTNVVQSLFARLELLRQLEAAGAGASAATSATDTGAGEDSGSSRSGGWKRPVIADAENTTAGGSRSGGGDGSGSGARRAIAAAAAVAPPGPSGKGQGIAQRAGREQEDEEEDEATVAPAAPGSGLQALAMPGEELERRFRLVWGNNADEMSLLYSGTPALKRDFTRTGKRTRMGQMEDGTNSLMRYVINNFYDHRRQEGVDLLLGVYRPREDPSLGQLPRPVDLDAWISLNDSAAAAAARSFGGGGGDGEFEDTGQPAGPWLEALRLAMASRERQWDRGTAAAVAAAAAAAEADAAEETEESCGDAKGGDGRGVRGGASEPDSLRRRGRAAITPAAALAASAAKRPSLGRQVGAGREIRGLRRAAAAPGALLLLLCLRRCLADGRLTARSLLLAVMGGAALALWS